MIAFDTETHLITPGDLAPPMVCLTWWTGEGEGRIATRDEAGDVWRWMLGTSEILVGHNLAFDTAVLAAEYPDTLPAIWERYEEGGFQCTYIHDVMSKIADGSFQLKYKTRQLGASLSAQVWDHLQEKVEGKSGEDIWRLRYHELDGMPLEEWPQEAIDYAIGDAVYTYRLAAKRGLPDAALPDELRQTHYHFALHLSAVWGLRTDGPRVAELERSLQARVALANRTLRERGYKSPKRKREPDGDLKLNTKVVQREVSLQYGELGWTVPMTPSGKPSRSKANLKQLPCRGGTCEGGTWCDNPLHILAMISEDEGELSKYIEHLKTGVDHAINPRIMPLVATGRTSYSNPPLQQLPRRPGVRECIVARPGRVFCGADYSSHELVTFAQVLLDLFGRSSLADELRAGVDPLLAGAAERLGLTYDEAAERLAAGEARVKKERQAQKAVEYGYPGGLGTQTMVQYARDTFGIVMSEGEARRYKRDWQRRRPETYSWFELIGDLTQETGECTVVQPWSGRVRGGCIFTSACNTHFQGLAADMAKQAFLRVTRECLLEPQSPLYRSRPVLLMHDEIIIEAPEEGAAEAAERLAEVMMLVGSKACPDIPVKADPYMMRRWYKGAEAVRDAYGRLIPWEPK